MKLKDIDFPKDLLAAQQDGSLVIFAGAGISMSSPSNLPSFKSLVEHIAIGTRYEGRVDQPFDRILGDLERDKVEVKKITRNILGDSRSEPTKVHEILLKIASISEKNVRIVTTNLDPHFSTSAKNLGLDLEEYFAPALPLGNDFSGIVYLHGSVQKNHDRYVLTDSDFGKAYLIDGWATRFIKEMFLKYSVLFVGYSHDDTVMHYISRGMPPLASSRRFALAPDVEQGHWRNLGIYHLEYPLKDEPARYAALEEGLEEWHRHISMGILDHEKRIRSIVSQRPPFARDDHDYVLNRIEDKDTIQFFTKYAKEPEWIQWCDERGLFDGVFDRPSNEEWLSGYLAAWLSECFLKEHPYHLLSFIRSKKDIIGQELWTSLAWGLRRHSAQMDRRVFSIFLNLLIKNSPDFTRREVLEYLLEDCRLPEDGESAVDLFLFLTKPFIKMDEKLYVPEEKKNDLKSTLGYELNIKGTTHWLTRNWDRLFRKNLSIYGARMFFPLKEHIELAYYAIRPFHDDLDLYDPISQRRSAIERHGQNRYRFQSDFGCLLDFFSDVLEWASYENESISNVCASWIETSNPLFKRFSIFVISKSKFHSASYKCHWLLSRDLLFDYDCHHEVFALVKEIYPNISTEEKKKVIDAVLMGPKEQSIDITEDQKIYQVFRLLAWIGSVDGSCANAQIEIANILKKRPDFVQREHPDFLSYMSDVKWGGSAESPYSVEELLSMDWEKELDSMLSWTSQDRFYTGRSSLLSVLEEAVERNVEFSFGLIEILSAKSLWQVDLWPSIIKGWIRAKLSNENIQRILDFSIANKQILNEVHEFSDLLLSFVTKNESLLPELGYDNAMRLAETIWGVGKEIRNEEGQVADWLTNAINHHAGRLAQFWLHLLSIQNARAGKASFPTPIRHNLEMLLADKSYHGKLAKTVIASQFQFLFSCDVEWALKNVLVLFDIDNNRNDAEAAWDGYLSWGRWSDDLLEQMRPLYRKIFVNPDFLGTKEDRFWEYVAGICLYAKIQPLSNHWLQDFLVNSNAKSRKLFSQNLQWTFRNMNDEGRSIAWKGWIREYWLMRESGKPLKFDDDEKIELIEMGVFLEQDFPAAVDLFVSSVRPNSSRSSIYFSLKELNVEKHPESTLKLLLHILPTPGGESWVCIELEPLAEQLINHLRDKNIFRDDLIKLCNLLGNWKCPNAGALRDSIDNQFR